MIRLTSIPTLLVLITAPAFAVPNLQLDIANGRYDTASESTVTQSSVFTLAALLHGAPMGPYFLTVALIPDNLPPDTDFGTFSVTPESGTRTVFRGTDAGPTSDRTVSMKSHDTRAPESTLGFTFADDRSRRVRTYDVTADGRDWRRRKASDGDMLVHTFKVDVAGLRHGVDLRFGLQSALPGEAGVGGAFSTVRAPRTHEAETRTRRAIVPTTSGLRPPHAQRPPGPPPNLPSPPRPQPPVSVPDGASTLGLLVFGLGSVALLARHRSS